MSILKLRLSIVGTLALIIGLSTLFLTYILAYLGMNIISIALFIVLFNVAQWLFAPYLIDAMYRVKKVSSSEAPELHNMVERLSQKSGIKTPAIGIAKIPIPNAFAYGSPITGTRVAVTSQLLETLETEEVEAVIGHELGHLRHRDVQIMMFVSILPALFYYIGYSLFWSSQFSRRDERGNAGLAALIGMLSILIYFILNLFTLYLSRLREYYADNHSSSIVEDGARKLSEGLVKIAQSAQRIRTQRPQTSSLASFKALFISDPDSAAKDVRDIRQAGIGMSDRALVAGYLSKKITTADRIVELFSTHPNMVKRLRALQELA
jgi:heat shock protein HtpX